jgi:hypothetical protein
VPGKKEEKKVCGMKQRMCPHENKPSPASDNTNFYLSCTE